jgi:hypothetical protein
VNENDGNRGLHRPWCRESQQLVCQPEPGVRNWEHGGAFPVTFSDMARVALDLGCFIATSYVMLTTVVRKLLYDAKRQEKTAVR